ncbi:MAG: patatin-like phospholipase family protein [Pirellulaceae bacterium]
MTPNQSLALEQLSRIADVSDALQIVAVHPPKDAATTLRVDVSLYCRDMPRAANGLPLRDREVVTLWIPDDYPYDYPSVSVSHTRFAGYPHVSWACLLCLYQAPQTEWSPSAGIPGFLCRLELWFRKAAMDELDPTGGALHPPVAHGDRGPLLIPRRDTPAHVGSTWFGLAELAVMSDYRLDLVGWKNIGEPPTTGLAAAVILLDRPMPLEYPSKLGVLLRCLDARGVSLDSFLASIREVLKYNASDQPLYVVLGTPMRGTRGGELRQHLACWRTDAFAGDIATLEGRVATIESSARELGSTELVRDVEKLRQDIRDIFVEWAKDRSLVWCQVREDRPEVTIRRDTGRPASAFSGKSIEVWGCGALGSYMAEWIVRAGASRVVVRDESQISPGILVRQPYTDADIGRPKAKVLADRLRQIQPSCQVEGINGDILDGPLRQGRLAENVDLVIDATASNLVLTRIEEVWRHHPEARRTVASVAIDRGAERLLAVVAPKEHTGGPLDLVRRMKLDACAEPRLASYRDSFFPVTPREAFQPEPGCSDATFIGSAADAALLASMATNYIGETMRDGESTARGCFAAAPNAAGETQPTIEKTFAKDLVFIDQQTNYETRLDLGAWRTIESWKLESRRRRGADVETGGLLFGEMNEHLGIIWVSEVSGPPADSRHSAEEFVCGIDGTQSLNAEKAKRTRNSAQYVGTWHTHPVSVPIPSSRDLGAMATLLTQSPTPVERLLLLIVGAENADTAVTATVFLRKEFESLLRNGFMQRHFAIQDAAPDASIPRPRLGIALSGGGSRAMAFHLGCLRALHDRGLLNQADVLSTVSGGSVIGAMYAYSDDSFEEFTQRVRHTLRQGLVWGIASRTLLSPRILQIFWTQATSGVVANLSFVSRFVLGMIESLIPRASKAGGLVANQIQPPLRRWVSRTQAFEQTLKDLLFGDRKMGSARRGNLNVVLNACELRTGTAFRFGSRESGSWRYGVIEGNDVDVATAVAASAAYPALLPAIDRFFDFVSRGGERAPKRVILTDGGVYENLGVSCMTPDRDDAFSTNVFRPSYIICCDAGPGQFDDVVVPYGWTTRMRRSFEATYRQAQHGLQKQLHLWRQYGAIDGFVYAYLGQQDQRLPVQPPGFIRRDDVVHYPTDFSPMSEVDIDLLSGRGEQLARLLVEHYCPNI